MRILVIEDKEMHQQSARETLAGHEVTIVTSFDETMELMRPKVDEENVQHILADAGLPATNPYYKDRDKQEAYVDAWSKAEAASIVSFPFEAVLTDMMMPMSKETLVPKAFKPSEQVPYGFIIALRATLRGAKFIAMITDTNHHKGAMSAALDNLGPSYYEWVRDSKYQAGPEVFNINGAKVVFVHTPFVTDVTRDSDCFCGDGLCRDCKGTLKQYSEDCWCTRENQKDRTGKCSNCKGTLKYDKEVKTRKDWGRVLADLTA